MKYLIILIFFSLTSCYSLEYNYSYRVNRQVNTDSLNCYEITPLKGRKVVIYIWTKETPKEGKLITIREKFGEIYLREVDSTYTYKVSTVIKPEKLIK
jgi:hypothetical protein